MACHGLPWLAPILTISIHPSPSMGPHVHGHVTFVLDCFEHSWGPRSWPGSGTLRVGPPNSQLITTTPQLGSPDPWASLGIPGHPGAPHAAWHGNQPLRCFHRSTTYICRACRIMAPPSVNFFHGTSPWHQQRENDPPIIMKTIQLMVSCRH